MLDLLQDLAIDCNDFDGFQSAVSGYIDLVVDGRIRINRNHCVKIKRRRTEHRTPNHFYVLRMIDKWVAVGLRRIYRVVADDFTLADRVLRVPMLEDFKECR